MNTTATAPFDWSLIRSFLAARSEIKYVWCDMSCMPQGQRTAAEQAEFDSMLPHINLLYLGASVLVILDMSYMSRFWTQVREGWPHAPQSQALLERLGDHQATVIGLPHDYHMIVEHVVCWDAGGM